MVAAQKRRGEEILLPTSMLAVGQGLNISLALLEEPYAGVLPPTT